MTRRGFTVAEVLVGLVLAAVIIAALVVFALSFGRDELRGSRGLDSLDALQMLFELLADDVAHAQPAAGAAPADWFVVRASAADRVVLAFDRLPGKESGAIGARARVEYHVKLPAGPGTAGSYVDRVIATPSGPATRRLARYLISDFKVRVLWNYRTPAAAQHEATALAPAPGDRVERVWLSLLVSSVPRDAAQHVEGRLPVELQLTPRGLNARLASHWID